MKINSSLMAFLALGAIACGVPNGAQFSDTRNSSDQTGIKDDNGDDSTELDDGEGEARKSSKPSTKTSSKKKDTPHPQCPGVAAHDGMLECDADDVDVTNGDVPTAENPVAMPTETPAVETPSQDPNVVEFRIKAGTGTQAWNTQAEMVVAKVGQTIRIFNDDSVTHRLHTGGAPCPHGRNFAPGESYDCVVTRAVDPGTRPPTYDHIAGNSAFFWVKTLAE